MVFVFLFLTSLCMTDSGFIHVSTNDPICFLFVAEQYSTVHLHHNFFILLAGQGEMQMQRMGVWAWGGGGGGRSWETALHLHIACTYTPLSLGVSRALVKQLLHEGRPVCAEHFGKEMPGVQDGGSCCS